MATLHKTLFFISVVGVWYIKITKILCGTVASMCQNFKSTLLYSYVYLNTVYNFIFVIADLKKYFNIFFEVKFNERSDKNKIPRPFWLNVDVLE